MKSRLPGKKSSDIEAFISGAEDKTAKSTIVEKMASYPWEEPGVREDVTKVYNLRLPEPYLLKLKYIAENTPDSMHKFCLNVLQDAIDEKIEELTK
ncbi:MAG: hypothetical protein PHD43_02640 [Methylococcales bacterium]|nr:hypothetical protein [Methylococcales bacterium]